MKAFFRKELMELVRTGRFVIALLCFGLVGIMNPAVAKLTPWMTKMLAGQLQEAGIMAVEVTPDAMMSWTQFYKNIPLALLIFLILFSGIFTAEYERGTLIPVVTKGLPRWKIVFAKSVTAAGVWSVCYWLCFGITYVYNAYFWDNAIAAHLLSAAACYWLFGLFLCAVMMLFSVIMKGNIYVLLTTGAVFGVLYAAQSLIKKADFLPLKLTDGMQLLQNTASCSDYVPAAVVAAVGIVLCLTGAVCIFNRRQL